VIPLARTGRSRHPGHRLCRQLEAADLCPGRAFFIAVNRRRSAPHQHATPPSKLSCRLLRSWDRFLRAQRPRYVSLNVTRPNAPQARGLRLLFFRAIDVSSAEEFYKNADEHFRWAESAKTDRERAIFRQMAAAWLKVAEKWEDVTIDTARDRLGLM
jgi:hypothetical protein